MKKKYYTRISSDSAKEFESFLQSGKCEYYQISSYVDIGNKNTSLYSIKLNDEELAFMKLKFSLIGLLDYTKVLGRQKINIKV